MIFMNEDKIAFINLTDEQKLAIINAKQQGEVEEYHLHYDVWELRGSRTLDFEAIYRIKPTSLNIPWDVIKPEYQWVAMDKNGTIWAYELEPAVDNERWLSDYKGNMVNIHMLNIDTAGVDWKTSLTKRP